LSNLRPLRLGEGKKEGRRRNHRMKIYVVAPMGVKFGTEEGTPSSVPNFTPIGATCRPCGAKNLKIGLGVN